MSLKKTKVKSQKKLTPLPKGVVRLYGLLAILLVLIPEWIAELTISLRNGNTLDQLPKITSAWEEMPELKLSTMTLRELRNLALKLRIQDYARDRKNILTAKILKRINREISTKGSRRLFLD